MQQIITVAMVVVLTVCVCMASAAPNEKQHPYELILVDDKVEFDDSAKISMPLVIRDLGVQKMMAPTLYWGLSIVWDGKEYTLDPKYVGPWNGPGEIIPRTAWRTGVTVSSYQIPVQGLTPGRHTVSVRDKFAESNTLTVFIKGPDNKELKATR